MDFFLALVGLSCLGSLMLSWGRARVWKVASVSWRLRVLGGGQHPASPSHLMSLLSEAFLPPSPDSHWGRSLPPRTCTHKRLEGIYFILLKGQFSIRTSVSEFKSFCVVINLHLVSWL